MCAPSTNKSAYRHTEDRRIIESKKKTTVVLAMHSSATDTRGVTADPLTRFVFGSRCQPTQLTGGVSPCFSISFSFLFTGAHISHVYSFFSAFLLAPSRLAIAWYSCGASRFDGKHACRRRRLSRGHVPAILIALPISTRV